VIITSRPRNCPPSRTLRHRPEDAVRHRPSRENVPTTAASPRSALPAAASATLPHDLDVCATALGPLVTYGRGAPARARFSPTALTACAQMALEEPIYQNGAVPTDGGSRRERTFVAIIALTFLPKVILANALVGSRRHRGRLHYGGAHSKVVFHRVARSRQRRNDDRQFARRMDHRHVGLSYGSGLVGRHTSPWLILFAGIALSSPSRSVDLPARQRTNRIKALVHERTEALHFQALTTR